MKRIAIIFGLLQAYSAQGADITANQIILNSDLGSDRAESLVPGQYRLSAAVQQMDGLKVLPSKDVRSDNMLASFQGEYGIVSHMSVGIGVSAIYEELSQEAEKFSQESTGLESDLYLRYNFWNENNISASVVPFYELGLGSSESTTLASKSRLGVILEGQYQQDSLFIAGSTHYRYRPSAIHGNYRVASDRGWSVQPGWSHRNLDLWFEYASQSHAVLNINKAGNSYNDLNVATVSFGGSKDLSDFESIALVYSRGLDGKKMGSHRHRITLAYNVVSANSKNIDVPTRPGLEMTPSERVYWLDQLRKNMARRNQKVGNEMEAFTLNEKQSIEQVEGPSDAEQIRAADVEIEKLKKVDKKIQLKKVSPKATVKQEIEPVNLPLEGDPNS